MAEQIRLVKREDVRGLKEVLDSSQLFPSEMLDNMISDYFENENTEDIWFTKTVDNLPIALGYCAPEKLTNGTYNLYALAVRKEAQGSGIGVEMIEFIEDFLRKKSARILLIETSSNPEFELTQKFYAKLGYHKEATIREFWGEGEDKLVFWKKL